MMSLDECMVLLTVGSNEREALYERDKTDSENAISDDLETPCKFSPRSAPTMGHLVQFNHLLTEQKVKEEKSSVVVAHSGKHK